MGIKKATKAAKKMVPSYESNPILVVFNNFINMFKLNTATAVFFVASTVVFVVLYLIFVFVVSYLTEETTGSTAMTGTNEEFSVAAAVLTCVFIFFILLLYVFLAGMANYAGYRTHLKKKASFKETLNAVINKFGTLLLVSLIWIGIYLFWVGASGLGVYAVGELSNYWIASIVGAFFGLIIIRFLTRYTYVMYPVFAYNTSAMGAFKLTRKVTKGHLIEIFSQNAVNNIVGQFTMSVIVVPIYASSVSTMYPQMEAAQKSGTKTKIHWANWLIVGFITLCIALFAGITALLIIYADDIDTIDTQNDTNYNLDYDYDYTQPSNYNLNDNYEY
ncbi:MAG: hypothetical protein M3P98_02395 [bacterium]|nr:hypothetical protein [bacterium]